MPGNTDRTQKVLPSWSWWPTSGNQASEREAHLLCFSFPPWLPVSFTPDLNDYRVLGQSTWLWPEFPLVHSSDGCLRIHTWPGGKVGPPLGHMGCPSSSLFSRLRERIWVLWWNGSDLSFQRWPPMWSWLVCAPPINALNSCHSLLQTSSRRNVCSWEDL